jgi:hypothetical protein
MRVICAWCEEEGKHTLLREVGSPDSLTTSHGICHDHQAVMMKTIGQASDVLVLRPWHDEAPSRATLKGRRKHSQRTPARRGRCRPGSLSSQLVLPFS